MVSPAVARHGCRRRCYPVLSKRTPPSEEGLLWHQGQAFLVVHLAQRGRSAGPSRAAAAASRSRVHVTHCDGQRRQQQHRRGRQRHLRRAHARVPKRLKKGGLLLQPGLCVQSIHMLKVNVSLTLTHPHTHGRTPTDPHAHEKGCEPPWWSAPPGRPRAHTHTQARTYTHTRAHTHACTQTQKGKRTAMVASPSKKVARPVKMCAGDSARRCVGGSLGCKKPTAPAQYCCFRRGVYR